MTTPCTDVLPAYTEALAGQFAISETDDGCFVSTGFVRPDGESIELELESLADGRIRITDMGDSFGYLYVNGLTLSRTLMREAERISAGFGVSAKGSALSIEIDDQSMGNGLHSLIQATLAVSGLIRKRRPYARVRFDDEVESLIIRSGAPYDHKFKVQGQRELHTVGFHLDGGRNLLVHPISAAQESTAKSWAERWAYRISDILAANSAWSVAPVVDDRGQRSRAWTVAALTPIAEYAIRWSEQDQLEELIAG